MRREPSLTFDGALRIMGAGESKLIGRLDSVLGGIIVASGVAAAVAAIGPAAAAPLALLAPIWSWVDQKNEALKLLGDLTAKMRKRADTVSAGDRRRLIACTHTVIVVSAFFEALQGALSGKEYARLRITDQEKLLLTNGSTRSTDLLRTLYESEVPAPTPSVGFEENVAAVERWLAKLALRTQTFLEGLSEWSGAISLVDHVVPDAVNRYRQHYIALSTTIPEFAIWATLGEHSATRQAIREGTNVIQEALATTSTELRRINVLLSLPAAVSRSASDAQTVLLRANSARLDQPIIHRDEASTLGSVQLPLVRDAFVMPAFKVAQNQGGASIANEHWWVSQQRREDLDHWLSAFTLSPDATRRPLLVLGHPGAGKSMLMKVLAARFPESRYTVVLVPLRLVGANAPILDQIQQALDQATNRRVIWSDLADSSGAETIRVVILDGLDELLQASSSDRSSFLQDVMAFQQVEAEQNRPVITIVSSRTIVADRVDVPAHASIIKLEDFDEHQVDQWLRTWTEANAAPISSGDVVALSPERARAQIELARQPLLLLMLALYTASPDSSSFDEGVSSSELYGRLIEEFARREVAKSAHLVSRADVDSAVDATVRRLSVAALAMFNRGRQTVGEDELTADLKALLGASSDGDLADPGQRLLGEFFFMHTAEATLIGAGTDGIHSEGYTYPIPRRLRRSYEFMHATFGEYLVARILVEELSDIAHQAYSGRRPRDPEDDLLAAAISHQPLAVRRSVLNFVAELVEALAAPERARIADALVYLVQTYRERPTSERYSLYQPMTPDHPRRLAAYSSNLLMLRLVVAGDAPVSVHDLVPEPNDGQVAWRSMLNLWRSGFEVDGFHAMLSALSINAGTISIVRNATIEVNAINADYLLAQLSGDLESQARIRYGLALNDGLIIREGSDPARTLLTKLYADIAGARAAESVVLGEEFPSPLPFTDSTGFPAQEIGPEERLEVLSAIERLLLTRQGRGDFVADLISIVQSLDAFDDLNPLVLLVNACRFPSLLLRFPELADDRRYEDPDVALLMMRVITRVDRPTGEKEFTDPRVNVVREQLIQELSRRAVKLNKRWQAVPQEVAAVVTKLALNLRDDRWDDARDRSFRALHVDEVHRHPQGRLETRASRREREVDVGDEDGEMPHPP